MSRMLDTTKPSVEKVAVTLPGTVEKIIKPIVLSEP